MTASALPKINHWIAGREAMPESGASAPVFNPATGREQAEVMLAGPSEVDAAVQAAKAAFQSWRNVSLSRRTKVMFEFRDLVHGHADELARIISLEHGKVLSDAAGEVQRGLEVVEFACGLAELLKLSLIHI